LARDAALKRRSSTVVLASVALLTSKPQGLKPESFIGTYIGT